VASFLSDNIVHALPPPLPQSLETALGLNVQQLYNVAWPLLARDEKGAPWLWSPPPTPAHTRLAKGGCEELLQYIRQTFGRVIARDTKVSVWDLRERLLHSILQERLGADPANPTSPAQLDSTADGHVIAVPSSMPDITWLLHGVSTAGVASYVDSVSLNAWLHATPPHGLTALFRERLTQAAANAPSPADLNLLVRLAIICGTPQDFVRLAALHNTLKAVDVSGAGPSLRDLRDLTGPRSYIVPGPYSFVGDIPAGVLDAFAVTKTQTVVAVAGDKVSTIPKPWKKADKEVTIPGLAGTSVVKVNADGTYTLYSATKGESVVLSKECLGCGEPRQCRKR
jgi:hypothetical protein